MNLCCMYTQNALIYPLLLHYMVVCVHVWKCYSEYLSSHNTGHTTFMGKVVFNYNYNMLLKVATWKIG